MALPGSGLGWRAPTATTDALPPSTVLPTHHVTPSANGRVVDASRAITRMRYPDQTPHPYGRTALSTPHARNNTGPYSWLGDKAVRESTAGRCRIFENPRNVKNLRADIANRMWICSLNWVREAITTR